jgi:hypothetical protein
MLSSDSDRNKVNPAPTVANTSTQQYSSFAGYGNNSSSQTAAEAPTLCAAILEDHAFIKEDLPKAAILTLTGQFVTVVIMRTPYSRVQLRVQVGCLLSLTHHLFNSLLFSSLLSSPLHFSSVLYFPIIFSTVIFTFLIISFLHFTSLLSVISRMNFEEFTDQNGSVLFLFLTILWQLSDIQLQLHFLM